jgi:hypothetical protein
MNALMKSAHKPEAPSISALREDIDLPARWNLTDQGQIP